MNEQEWTQQTRRLNLNFPGQERRPESLASWYDEGDLADHPAWLISLAVRRIIHAHDYPPRSVAEFLRVVEEVRGELAREQASDATRTCPGCATELTRGWVEGDGGYYPCPDCRPGRHEAWAMTRKTNWPKDRNSRNLMAAEYDKATGHPTDKAMRR